MNVVLKLVDQFWNLRFIKGYRTKIAQGLLAGIGAYQWASTAKEVTSVYDLPDIPTALTSTILVYLSAKVAQFAKEHN